jgi:hypothetical protein
MVSSWGNLERVDCVLAIRSLNDVTFVLFLGDFSGRK